MFTLVNCALNVYIVDILDGDSAKDQDAYMYIGERVSALLEEF